MHYIIDEESYTSLMDWGKDNPDIVNARTFLQGFYEKKSHFTLVRMIQLTKDVEAYVKIGNNKIKIELKADKTQLFKFYIVPVDEEKLEFDIVYQDDIIVNDNIRETAEIVSRIFIITNMFMLYGNIVDYDDRKLSGQKQKGNIVFRPFKGTIYAVNIGDRVRKSPEGIFEVRGHLRHYKSGKLVWIEPFLKGVDKDKPKI